MSVPEDSAHAGKESFKDRSIKGSDVEKETTAEFQAKDSYRTDIGKGGAGCVREIGCTAGRTAWQSGRVAPCGRWQLPLQLHRVICTSAERWH